MTLERGSEKRPPGEEKNYSELRARAERGRRRTRARGTSVVVANCNWYNPRVKPLEVLLDGRYVTEICRDKGHEMGPESPFV